MRLTQEATLATRPAKTHASLAELTDGWRPKAVRHVGLEQVAWVAALKDRNDLPLLRADDLGDPILTDAGEAVVASVSERHATHGRQNLLAEAHRTLHGVRFARHGRPGDRRRAGHRHCDPSFLVAHPASGAPHPGPLHPCRRIVPAAPGEPDGVHHPVPPRRETRLLTAGRTVDGPTVAVAKIATVADAILPGRGHGLSVDQALAVEKIAVSGRVLDVLVGPAGTGKTSTMAGLRTVWETEHGPGSVIGLDPSAAAAEVLGDELGIDTENTAKWLTEWRRIPDLVAQRDHLADQLARHPHHRRRSRRATALGCRARCMIRDVYGYEDADLPDGRAAGPPSGARPPAGRGDVPAHP
jgi:hypothetical protein